jgi:hypothetical protein
MAYVEEPRAAVVGVVHPKLSGRAVIAGWLIAVAVAGLLYVGGLALGFTAFDAHNAGASAKEIGWGTAGWVVLTWAAALFLGGMFASWFDGNSDQTMGTMHGLTVWGLSMAATGLWLALGAAHAAHGGMQAGAYASRPAMGSPMSGPVKPLDGDGSILVLQSRVSHLLGQGDHRDDSRISGAVVAALIADKPDAAANLLAADSTLSPTDAASAVQGLTPQVDAAKNEAKQIADRTAKYTARLLWIGFISGLIALIAAALGGSLGAGQIRRVYHLRRYD